MSSEYVREVSISDKKALKRFTALERELLGPNPLYISEIDADVIKGLSGRSRFFSETEHTLFVASGKGRDLARCAALINRRYQEAKNEDVGFIGYFAASADSGPQVRMMFEHAEAWLKERGVTRVISPHNGATFLGMGLLTAAYDEEPMFPFGWHPPYYKDYLTDAGYEPAYPLWYYRVDFSSDKYRAVTHRVAGNNSVLVRPINKKRWNQDLDIYRQLINETFKDEREFHPLTSDELHEFLDPQKLLLDPYQMLIGEVEGEPVGWCMGVPDLGPLFRSFKGKIGIIQIIKLLLLSRRYRRAGLVGIGVLPGYKGIGLAQALAATLYGRYEKRGMKESLYCPVNELNTRSRRFAESMGGTGRVLYHCYDKCLR